MSPDGLTPGGTGGEGQPFELDVVRPDDLLVLRFQFFNLRLDPDGPGRLVRIDPAADAFVVIAFQPQHLQEQVFEESEAGDEPLVAPPVVAVVARESRLAFRLPAEPAALALTLDVLLDWDRWEPSLAANALPAAPTAAQLAARVRPAAPGPTQTSVELPYRLVLSPTEAGRWTHARLPQDRDGRVELWHTRLAALGADGAIEEGETDDHPVRAVWSPDLDPSGLLLQPSAWPSTLRQALEPFQRRAIVQLSADFGQSVKGGFYPAAPAIARRLMLTALGGWLDVTGRWPTPEIVLPPPGTAGAGSGLKLDPDVAIRLLEDRHLEDALALTQPAEPAAAGSARAIEGRLSDTASELNPIHIAFPPAPSLGEIGWVHRARGGRDEYVEYELPGLLWPLGHLASLIFVTERKFEPFADRFGAYLRKRQFIKVTQPVRDYRASAGAFPHAGRELPFTVVRFATLVTPNLDEPPGPSAEIPAPFFPTIGGSAYDFALLATDHEERPLALAGPLLFVPFDISIPIADSVAKAVPAWAGAAEARRTATARPAPVAFAPVDRQKEKSGVTTATCHAVVWGVATSTAEAVPAGETSVLPAMASANVSVPALAQVSGAAAAAATTPVNYSSLFLDHGFGGANASHLYLETAGALPAAAAPERSGGVAAPSFAVEALSKSFGPVGDAAGIGAGKFDPGQFLPTAKLFGAIDLKDLIAVGAPWADPDAVYPPELRDVTLDALRAKLDDPGVRLRVPVLAHREVITDGKPVAVETLYAWKPEITHLSAGVLELNLDEGAELVLSVSGLAPVGGGGKATSRVEGRLTHFTLDFADVIRVSFERFAFTSSDGARPDIHVDGVQVAFHGALSFVQTVEDILPSNGFADPPFLTVLPTGITAGYTLDIPTLGIGVVSIEGLALGASVSLPFTGDPAGVRFAISSREHPFLVTVSLFGGGGFFAFGVTTSGPPQVEAAIEFGGNFSLSIGVASGNVHVMAGIYFKMLGSQVELSGYLRLGGSVCVLGIVTISVEFYLALTYDNGKAYGEATLTVSVDVFGLSKSVSLHVEKQFAGAAGDPTFGELVDPPAWNEYCNAFAPLTA